MQLTITDDDDDDDDNNNWGINMCNIIH